MKKKKQKQVSKKMEVGIVRQNRKLLFVRRPESGLLSGMWSFPIAEATIGQGFDIKKKLGETIPELGEPVFIGTSRHVFSHIIWEMSVYSFNLDDLVCETNANAYLCDHNGEHPSDRQTTFVALSQVDDLALPIAFSKLLSLIKE